MVINDNGYLVFIENGGNDGEFILSTYNNADEIMNAFYTVEPWQVINYKHMEDIRPVIRDMRPGQQTYFGFKDFNNFTTCMCIKRLGGINNGKS